MVYQIILAYIFIVILDIKELMKIKQNKIITFTIYVILIFSGLTIFFLLVVDKAPISPAIIIEDIIQKIMGTK